MLNENVCGVQMKTGGQGSILKAGKKSQASDLLWWATQAGGI